MTINDILPQMARPPARQAHAETQKSKSALASTDENAVEGKIAASFETLVKEITGKAEKRSGRTAEVEDADTGHAKDDTPPDSKEQGPVSAIATQAMLAFGPFRVSHAEAAVASGDAAGALVEDARNSGKREAPLPDMDEEIRLGESADTQAQKAKAEGETGKNADMTGHSPEGRPAADRPVPDPSSRPNNEDKTSVATDAKPPMAPSAGGDGTRGEAGDKDVKPAAPRPDAGAATQGRGSEAPDSGILQQATQGRTSGAGNPPGPADAAANPSRPAMRIADVEIVSERSYGATKTLNIRLQPVDLGTVTARLRLVPDGMQVELVADRRDTAERLAADRDMLSTALRTAGFDDKAVLSITVTERGQSSMANMSGNQAGQQNFAAQDQSAGRHGAHSQANMQGEGNGNRDQRGGWGADEPVGGTPSSTGDARDGRPLSRGLVV
ncbi:flagellar hook-length control protein FliK [Mesorhizobium sp. RMAD-H1]|uniref:flagellar hook-length control protein FliK n=1 Tax=Mesorhizobium sp. RMAD-H1 TaxID=2587065 RepID=UPI00161437EA|nr:flagellar hook-length control protein FliK [Mesorhizobium sp. RMAD-H1]MBB2973811.1 chemotaxis protein MotD [Mesorhizobium sp. RMAD-H1]